MQIEWVETAKLRPNPKNRNQHSDEQIERLSKIIQYQGWRFPIVADKDNTIWAGHGRVLAAKKLGEKTVPVSYQEFTSEDQAYAFLVSDNAIASWAELDFSGINSDIGDLGPDFDIDMLGLKDFKIDVFEAQCDEDDVPDAPKEPKTRIGDIYQLGRHRLMCGDSTEIECIESLMGGQKSDICFTSPPYNLGVSSKLSGNSKVAKRGSVYETHNDAMGAGGWLSLVSTATEMSLKFSRYSFWNVQPLAGNRTEIWEYFYAFRDRYVDSFIWDKQHAPPQQAERVVILDLSSWFVSLQTTRPRDLFALRRLFVELLIMCMWRHHSALESLRKFTAHFFRFICPPTSSNHSAPQTDLFWTYSAGAAPQ